MNYFILISGTLARKIPWREEPGRLQSMGLQRVGHDWATSVSLFTFMHWRRKWQPTPVFLAGESQGRGNLVGCHLWVAQSQTQLKQLSSSSSSSNSWLLINLKQFPMPGLFITLEPLELNRKQYVNKHPILRTLLLTGNLCSSFLYWTSFIKF